MSFLTKLKAQGSGREPKSIHHNFFSFTKELEYSINKSLYKALLLSSVLPRLMEWRQESTFCSACTMAKKGEILKEYAEPIR